MSNTKQVHYFGKLRRRREFVKASGLARDYYYDWEAWFCKCSNANSLLPFLNTRSRAKPVWLLLSVDKAILKVGLTTLSSDMSERKYPFLVYFENAINQSYSPDQRLRSILSMAGKYEGFVNMIANGDFTVNEESYFNSTSDSYTVVDQLKEALESIVPKIVETNCDSKLFSFWINLDNFSIISHQGAFTCTLYNKIYG